jgi:hypothetical protein
MAGLYGAVSCTGTSTGTENSVKSHKTTACFALVAACTMPIHFASAGGHLSAVKILQSVKDTSRTLDTMGNTPPALAVSQRHTAVVRELLTAIGGRPAQNDGTGDAKSEATLLHTAVSNHDVEIV